MKILTIGDKKLMDSNLTVQYNINNIQKYTVCHSLTKTTNLVLKRYSMTDYIKIFKISYTPTLLSFQLYDFIFLQINSLQRIYTCLTFWR